MSPPVSHLGSATLQDLTFKTSHCLLKLFYRTCSSSGSLGGSALQSFFHLFAVNFLYVEGDTISIQLIILFIFFFNSFGIHLLSDSTGILQVLEVALTGITASNTDGEKATQATSVR